MKQIRQAPRIVQFLLVEQFLEGFVPIMALYAIMFQRVGGLNLQQIGLLFSLWSLAYVVAELPSGVLADFWSRKKVIMLGGLLRVIGFAVWIAWPNFVGYAIGFALWGMMIACSSGAVTAWLHNELRQAGQDKLFSKYFGWIMSSFSAGMLVSYLIAAVLTLHHSTLLITLSVASSAAMIIVLLPAAEHAYKRQDTYLKTLRAGLAAVARNKLLRFMCIGLFTVYMVVSVLEELLPRVYASVGLNDTAVSLFLAASIVATVLLLARLESFVRYSLSKQFLTMCAGAVVLIAGLYLGAGLAAAGLVLLFDLVFQLFRPVFQHHVQKYADSDERATIGSIPGLGAGVLGAVAYAIIGRVAQATNERLSIGLYTAFWLVVLAVLAALAGKYRNTA